MSSQPHWLSLHHFSGWWKPATSYGRLIDICWGGTDLLKRRILPIRPSNIWVPMRFELEHHWHGYGSIPIDTFLVGWTSINPSYFDVNYRGTRFWPIPTCKNSKSQVIADMAWQSDGVGQRMTNCFLSVYVYPVLDRHTCILFAEIARLQSFVSIFNNVWSVNWSDSAMAVSFCL